MDLITYSRNTIKAQDLYFLMHRPIQQRHDTTPQNPIGPKIATGSFVNEFINLKKLGNHQSSDFGLIFFDNALTILLYIF